MKSTKYKYCTVALLSGKWIKWNKYITLESARQGLNDLFDNGYIGCPGSSVKSFRIVEYFEGEIWEPKK